MLEDAEDRDQLIAGSLFFVAVITLWILFTLIEDDAFAVLVSVGGAITISISYYLYRWYVTNRQSIQEWLDEHIYRIHQTKREVQEISEEAGLDETVSSVDERVEGFATDARDGFEDLEVEDARRTVDRVSLTGVARWFRHRLGAVDVGAMVHRGREVTGKAWSRRLRPWFDDLRDRYVGSGGASGSGSSTGSSPDGEPATASADGRDGDGGSVDDGDGDDGSVDGGDGGSVDEADGDDGSVDGEGTEDGATVPDGAEDV